MITLSSKLRRGAGGLLLFWCAGCDEFHAISDAPGRWTWNQDVERPTFSPSVLVRGTKRLTDEEHARIMAREPFEPTPFVCHSFVTNGRIQYLADSTHALAGQTVELADWPADRYLA